MAWNKTRLSVRPERHDEPVGIERIRGGYPLPRHLRGAIIALGNFDGFHLGHQEVARHTRKLADERGVAAIVATFDPHPVQFFRSDHPPFRLTSLDQRQRAIAAVGIDAMMVFDFDQRLAAVSPDSFVQGWLQNAGGVVTGTDFSFGNTRSGDVVTLQRITEQHGLSCCTVKPIELDGTIVSSTRIRKMLQEGDFTAAARFLTRPFAFEGRLAPSMRSAMNFPLTNAGLILGDYVDIPHGIYAIQAYFPGSPTLCGAAYSSGQTNNAERTLELFLVDLESSHIGRPVEIKLMTHLHDANEPYDLSTLQRRIKNGCMQTIPMLAFEEQAAGSHSCL